MEAQEICRPTLSYKIQPWVHQREAIERATALPHFAFLFEVGTGKTSASINTMRAKYAAAGRIVRTLVVTPLVTLKNWRNEWLMHSELEPRDVVVLKGQGPKRFETFDRYAWTRDGKGQKKPRGVVFITNYETLLMRSVFDALQEWGVEALICDEAHRLKNIHAKRTRAAIRIADKALVRHILTGTPVLNSPDDIFAQWRILDGGATFGENFYAFRRQYFYDKNAGMPKHKYFPKWVPKPETAALISREIGAVSMAVAKKDCLDLPPLVRETIHVELGKEQRRLYDEMKRDFIAFVETTDGQQVAVATLAMTKAQRMMEICSGFVTVQGEEGEFAKKRLDDNPRADALQDLLEDLAPNHKIIVWAVWREDFKILRDVCGKLGLRYVEVHGDISATEKQEAVDAFNTDPEVRVLVGNPAAGGIGINLVASDVTIYYSRTFSLEHDLQSEARNYRGGSEIHEKVTRYDIVATGTIDEEVMTRLKAKQAIGDAVLRDIAKTLQKGVGDGDGRDSE